MPHDSPQELLESVKRFIRHEPEESDNWIAKLLFGEDTFAIVAIIAVSFILTGILFMTREDTLAIGFFMILFGLGVLGGLVYLGFILFKRFEEERKIKGVRGHEIGMEMAKSAPSVVASIASMNTAMAEAEERVAAASLNYLHEMGVIKLNHQESERVRRWEESQGYLKRTHEASESGKDRDLALTRLTTELTGKINLLEARMSFENPSAHAESMEELDRLRGDITLIETIHKLKDDQPLLYKHLMDGFLKDRYKRGR